MAAENTIDKQFDVAEIGNTNNEIDEDVISIDALIAGLMRRHHGYLGSLLMELNNLEEGHNGNPPFLCGTNAQLVLGPSPPHTPPQS